MTQNKLRKLRSAQRSLGVWRDHMIQMQADVIDHARKEGDIGPNENVSVEPKICLNNPFRPDDPETFLTISTEFLDLCFDAVSEQILKESIENDPAKFGSSQRTDEGEKG